MPPWPHATGKWLCGSLATSPATVIKLVFDQAEARDLATPAPW